MTLKECYFELDGDYTDVKQRLKNPEKIIHFLKMFANENLYAKLQSLIEFRDIKAAFHTAHSLKGNCMSLGFTRLQKPADKITEKLRSNRIKEAVLLLEPLKAEYERTVKIIACLEN